jgi:hypothetical protein
MRWAGHVARMGEERREYKVLMGKPKGKWPLGRQRRKWEDEQGSWEEIGWGGGGWSGFSWLSIGAGGGLLWMR